MAARGRNDDKSALRWKCKSGGESRTRFIEVWFVQSLSETLLSQNTHGGGRNTVDLELDFCLWKASFPLLGLLCATPESVFELLCVGLEHSLVPAHAVHLLSRQTSVPSGLQMSFPIMTVTDFRKFHSTSSQFGRKEVAFQACRWEGRGALSGENIYCVVSGCQHLYSCFDIPFIKT